jgi:DNA-directed RNA polymerase subunit RPC12/RpoP
MEQKEQGSANKKCPECGGQLVFDMDTKGLKCEYCNYTEAIESLSTKKLPFDNVEDKFNSWNKETKIVRCSNCGANEVVDSLAVATVCPFCGSNKLISTDLMAGLKPNAIIPFEIDEKEMKDHFDEWLKKRKFVPNNLKKMATISSFRSVYTPSWDFDSNAFCIYSGTLYRTERDKDGNTKSVPFFVSGNIKNFYNDIFIEVGDGIDKLSFSDIEPFPFSSAVEYKKEYLTGFYASHYRIGATQAFDEAKNIMKISLRNMIINKYNADSVGDLDMKITYSNNMYSYVLLPIWLNSYKYKNKEFKFYANGKTGKISGSVPHSPIKITIYVIISIIISLLIGYFADKNFSFSIIPFVVFMVIMIILLNKRD